MPGNGSFCSGSSGDDQLKNNSGSSGDPFSDPNSDDSDEISEQYIIQETSNSPKRSKKIKALDNTQENIDIMRRKMNPFKKEGQYWLSQSQFQPEAPELSLTTVSSEQ